MSETTTRHGRVRRMIGRRMQESCSCGEPWPCPVYFPRGNWSDDWEPAGRDRDGNLILRYRETGGLYHLLPAEDL